MSLKLAKKCSEMKTESWLTASELGACASADEAFVGKDLLT